MKSQSGSDGQIPAPTPGSIETEWRFLPGLTSTYSPETRAFVLRPHQRRKRRAEQQQAESFLRLKSQEDNYATTRTRVKLQNVTVTQEYRQLEPHSPFSSTPASGKFDPFASWALVLNRHEERLIHHYAYDIHSNLGVPPTASYIPSRDIMLRENLRDELTVLAMLFYATASLESKNASPHTRSSYYGAKLYRMINRRLLVESSNPSSGLIIAVCGAIMTYTEPKLERVARPKSSAMMIHVHGLSALINAAGGWHSVGARSDMLCYLINWVDICFSGSLSVLCMAQVCTAHPSSQSEITSQPPSLLYLRLKEFLNWYKNLRKAAMERRRITATRSNLEVLPPATMDPADLFQSSGPVYEIIQRSKVHNIRPIVPLLFAHIVMLSCERYPQIYFTPEAIYDTWLSALQGAEVLKHGSLESLIWALISDRDRQRILHSDLLERLREQLYLVSRLSLETIQTLEATLLDFLQKIPTDDLCHKWWTDDDLREVMLNDLIGQLQ